MKSQLTEWHRPYWWQVNISSGNGLVPSQVNISSGNGLVPDSTKPLPDRVMLTKSSDATLIVNTGSGYLVAIMIAATALIVVSSPSIITQ